MASAIDSNREKNPHRIALCITELDVGGAERFLVELATRLDKKQFAPTIYCLGPRPQGAGEALATRLAVANVPAHFLGARDIGDAWRVLRRLRNELQRQRPALVQTLLFHANLLGPLAARGLFVDAEHKMRVPIVTGLRVAEPRRWWRRALERWAGRYADRHVAVSEGVARFAVARVGLAAKKIVVIPNGVDIERFPAPAVDPKTIGVRHGQRFVLFVGRLDKDDQKGASRLLEHAPALLDKLDRHDLVMIGDGPSAEALRHRTAQIGLQDRVHWLGRRDDLPSILAAADLLIAPSRWEGMSNVVLEAMASVKPIVAQAAEGISELLGDQSLQIVPMQDWMSFLDRICAVANDISLQLELGRTNRQTVASRFRLDQTIAAYERLYSDLIDAFQALSDRRF